MQSHDTTNVMIYLIGELDIFENQRFFILFINMGYLACFIPNDITSNNLIGLREGQYKTTCMGHSSDLYERAKCRSGFNSIDMETLSTSEEGMGSINHFQMPFVYNAFLAVVLVVTCLFSQ